MEYTEEQEIFISMVKDFYYNQKPRKEYLVLSGLPGVGKSFIVSRIQEELHLGCECVYAVRTGKAATVLQSKGVPAITIHRLIYELDDPNRLTFRKKSSLDGEYKLIIIDEFSTVDQHMMNDLLSFGIPLIIVGDADQLPPIGEATRYLNNPDFKLTKILRQSQDSYIVALARSVLKGKVPMYGDYGTEGNKVSILRPDQLTYEMLDEADQILCGTNAVRSEINDMIRKKKGYVDYLPEPGEKLIITKNCWNDLVGGMPIINGTTGFVEKIKDTPDRYFVARFRPEYTQERKTLCIDKNFFVGKTTDKTVQWVTAEWGYCITVHKAQGSEYNKVVFIASNSGFQRDPVMYKKFLNTGITRAKKELILVI